MEHVTLGERDCFPKMKCICLISSSFLGVFFCFSRKHMGCVYSSLFPCLAGMLRVSLCYLLSICAIFHFFAEVSMGSTNTCHINAQMEGFRNLPGTQPSVVFCLSLKAGIGQLEVILTLPPAFPKLHGCSKQVLRALSKSSLQSSS